MRYGVETKMSPSKVLDKAVTYFGPEGLGLDVTSEEGCCARFEGSGGYVLVTADEAEGHTEVDLETREWDFQVKQFMSEIG
jgi:hypothetical protein